MEAAGVQEAIHSGIVLNVDDRLAVNFTLELVRSARPYPSRPTLCTSTRRAATAAGVISGLQLRELSLNSRNYAQLVLLVPGASDSGNADQIFPGATAPIGTNVMTFQINGGRREENNWQVDGADNVDRGSNLTLLSFPSIDAISEFRVVRGAYDAESGRSAGAQVNVITRSGTSDIHGGVYEFFRNNVLNANSFFNNATNPVVPRPVLRYNDFGGTIGGPVWIPKIYEQRNKTFFFVSEEARRIVTYSNPTATVPYSGMTNGQFNHVVCTQWANSNGAAGPCTAYGTSIPTTSIDPIATAYVKDLFSKFPLPNAATAASPFTDITTLGNIFNFREDMIKIDHVFGPKLSVNGKFLHDSNPTVEAGGLFTSLPVNGIATTSTNSPGHQYNIAATFTPNAKLVIEAGYRYSYGAILSSVIGAENFSQSPDVKTALGSALPFANLLGRVPTISLTGGTGISTFGPYNDFNVNHTAYGNVTKVVGSHTLKFGAIYYHYNKHENQLTGSNNGSFSFRRSERSDLGDHYSMETLCAPVRLPLAALARSRSSNPSPTFCWVRTARSRKPRSTSPRTFSTTSSSTTARTPGASGKTSLSPTVSATRSSVSPRMPAVRVAPAGSSILIQPFMIRRKPPALRPSGAMDVKLVNGVPTSSACNPNYNPLNGLIFADPPTFNGFVGTKSPYGSKVGKEFNRAIAPRIGIAWDPWGNGRTSVRARLWYVL